MLMNVIGIPEDLAERASLVPGLTRRVERFIRFEIIQHEQRSRRFDQQTLDLVAQAKKDAQLRRVAGFIDEDVRKSFARHLQEINKDESSC